MRMRAGRSGSVDEVLAPHDGLDLGKAAAVEVDDRFGIAVDLAGLERADHVTVVVRREAVLRGDARRERLHLGLNGVERRVGA